MLWILWSMVRLIRTTLWLFGRVLRKRLRPPNSVIEVASLSIGLLIVKPAMPVPAWM